MFSLSFNAPSLCGIRLFSGIPFSNIYFSALYSFEVFKSYRLLFDCLISRWVCFNEHMPLAMQKFKRFPVMIIIDGLQRQQLTSRVLSFGQLGQDHRCYEAAVGSLQLKGIFHLRYDISAGLQRTLIL